MTTAAPARWLIPVDGSNAALNAVRQAIHDAGRCAPAPEIDLVNVQAPLSNNISRFINGEILKEYHQEAGASVIKSARELLEQSGLTYRTQVLIGDPATTIADFANSHGSTLIIMGARGLGSVIGALLGSVTVKVVHLSPVPVLLVK